MSRESSLKASFIDDIFAYIMFGLTVNYITPFALLMGANGFQIGLLNSLPQLLGSIVQLKTTDVLNRMVSRVKMITICSLLQALILLIICMIFLVPKQLRIHTFIALIVVSSMLGSVFIPVWTSLMSDIVEKSKYGEYFAHREKILGIIGLISNLIAGFFLFIFPNKFLGFIILFFVAGICRIISGIYHSKMDDVPVHRLPEKDFSYLQFIRRYPESNFVKFVVFVSLINFATFLAAPFFAVHMLDELKFKYSTFTIIMSAEIFAKLISLPFWGKLADRYGNAQIIKSSARFVPLMPLLWMLSKDPVYLMIISIFSGYVWAGFELSTINFIFDATSRETRTRCIAYFNLSTGISIFLGTLIGGYLIVRIPGIFFYSQILTVFFISGVARFLVNILMLDKFREVRPAEEIEDKEILRRVLSSPVLGLGEGIYRLLRRRF